MPKLDIYAIPKYAAAAAQEQSLRDAAFLELPEWIGNVPVQPLTLQLYNRLVAIRSPFVVGGERFSAVDIGNVLWTVSPEWRPMKIKTNRHGQPVAAGLGVWAKWWFLRKYRGDIVVPTRTDDGKKALLPCATTALDIHKYIAEAFYDSYSGGTSARRKSYMSWNAVLIHDFKKAYGWEPEKTQSVPLRILFQLRKSILRDIDPKFPLYNRSDMILEDEFRARNERLQASLKPEPTSQE